MTNDEKLNFIKNALVELFKKDVTVLPTDELLDLGLDSLDIVELQMYYEDMTGEETDPDVTVKTVSDLMALMK